MPEIAEVARLVHFLRLHLVGKKIAKVTAPDDTIIFGKVGTSGPEFEKALKGRKVVSAGSQGKYFWITFDQPPHAVMHLGMTGWIHIKGERTAYTNYYKKMNKPGEADQWPPKFWKFILETEGNSATEVVFTDPRRLGRVRLVDCPGKDIRKHSPLVENGPDPVVDADIFTEDFLRGKMRKRHVPIKALLLDQTMISGIGNWVADEVLYQARLHPEQYSDDFDDKQIKTLHTAVRHVTQTAVDLLGDSDQFPENWLFNHRWGKGGKGSGSTLPNGEKLAFITVGGRTSCYAPALQKKTGRVPAGAKVEPIKEEADEAPNLKSNKKEKKAPPPDADEVPSAKRKRSSANPQPNGSSAAKKKKAAAKETPAATAASDGRRRSGRVKGASS